MRMYRLAEGAKWVVVGLVVVNARVVRVLIACRPQNRTINLGCAYAHRKAKNIHSDSTEVCVHTRTRTQCSNTDETCSI